MRVVVTGAAGFVGSHLCERLVTDGHDVVAIDGMIAESYSPAQKKTNLLALDGCDRFTLHEVDLRHDELDAVLDGAEAIVHLAAMPGLLLSWDRLALYASCNLVATGRLIDAAQRVGISRFVHGSTSSVYGRVAVGNESLPVVPASPYGVTKLAAEQLLRAHHENFALPVVVLRYFSIYGPRQRPDMAYHRFIERVLDDEPITVFGDGEQTRSITYIDDCVDATLLALAYGHVGEVYNVGGGQVLRLHEALARIGELAGRHPAISYAPARPGDQRSTCADTSKAWEHFGYRPRYAALDGLERQFDWHLARRRHRG